jgi:hypothetical protein
VIDDPPRVVRHHPVKVNGDPPQVAFVLGEHEVPFPDCPIGEPKRCRLDPGPVCATRLPRRPIYDRTGQDLSIDPNTYRCGLGCRACGALWTLTASTDSISVERITTRETNFPLAKSAAMA